MFTRLLLWLPGMLRLHSRDRLMIEGMTNEVLFICRASEFHYLVQYRTSVLHSNGVSIF